MTGIPTNPNEWGQFTQQLQQVVPQRTENLGMMAQWGGEEDNWLRSYGAKMPSPTPRVAIKNSGAWASAPTPKPCNRPWTVSAGGPNESGE